jgi:hypothetical protein
MLDLGKVFPLEHLAKGLQTCFLLPGSTGITAANLAVLIAWGAAALLTAIKTFQWEPKPSGGS